MQKPTARVFIGFGSNLGSLYQNFRHAFKSIHSLSEVFSLKPSQLYSSEPLTEGQPWYLNAVFEIETSLTPAGLFEELKAIEKEMGRKKRKKWDSRIVDLDILYYDQLIYHDDELTIPHPSLHERPFVLLPLLDLAPDWVHPELQLSQRELFDQLRSDLKVMQVDEEALQKANLQEAS